MALALLQPSVFPELLQGAKGVDVADYPDPGVAAVEAGHTQLLGWLLHRCPGLLCPVLVLKAAALRCDLAVLQQVWALLSHRLPVDGGDAQGILDAAAASPSLDAIAKMEFLLAAAERVYCSCSPQTSTVAAAASSGDLGRLRWLRDQGCPISSGGDSCVLQSALQHADLAVAQWLVDEAGCSLPDMFEREGSHGAEQRVIWWVLLIAAVQGSDPLAKLRWLQERGGPSLGRVWQGLVSAAVEAGRVGVVRNLMSHVGPGGVWIPVDVAEVAVTPGSSAITVAAGLRWAGEQLSYIKYADAAESGSVALVRLLACEAGVSARGLTLPLFVRHWPNGTPGQSRDLLEAVQLVVGVAGCRDWDAEEAISEAATRGDWALAQYLVHQQPRVQLGTEAVDAAARGGCEVLLEWLVVQPGCRERLGSGGLAYCPYYTAAKAGDRGTMEVLWRLGVPWGAEDVVVRAVRVGCELVVLRWLVEQGAPVGRMAGVEEVIAQRVGRGLSAEGAAWLRSLVAL